MRPGGIFYRSLAKKIPRGVIRELQICVCGATPRLFVWLVRFWVNLSLLFALEIRSGRSGLSRANLAPQREQAESLNIVLKPSSACAIAVATDSVFTLGRVMRREWLAVLGFGSWKFWKFGSLDI